MAPNASRPLQLGFRLEVYRAAQLTLPVALIQQAEALGYHSVWSAEAYGADALTPLAYLAAVTRHIKLGTAIAQVAARPPTALAMAVISIAAIFLAVRVNFDPASGPARLLYAFEAVIIGGLGSLWGTLAGGVVLGVAQAVGAQLNPGWESLAGHIAFLVVLIFRPRGLFPKLVD